MSKRRLSLINVLNPPVNRWLQEISRKNAALPAGVRVIRFGNNDSDDLQDQPWSLESGSDLVSTRKAA